MKKLLLLSLILTFAPINFCIAKSETIPLNATTNMNMPNSAQSVAEKANKMYGNTDNGYMSNPIMNSTMGGYYNIMQGSSGNFSNNMQEVQRQQMDYAKQQMNNPHSDDE